ncbi:MAG TPA: amidase [Stellaceae bacterium]|jgi:Asp-tRNA(Asn)/Glu-tRNA(Gln) amidotransferase A subunit family amidase|nr:amidase [Stellaceae bacterium]
MTPRLRPYLPATSAFAAGTDSPRDFLERCLAEIEARESVVGAFVALNIEGARAAADQSTARWKAGKPLSPIDGMPIGAKDIIETFDMPTEEGSPLFPGRETHRDGASVSALREAGAVILGKTVTTEFAATEPRGTRNPHDPERTPGGSSSGSAAGVGCGMISAGLGSQVIGSILRPSSFCGCYGFKPSVGALNRSGSFDIKSQSCAGVLAASLAECWVVSRQISSRIGGDPGYPGLSGPMTIPAAKKPPRLAVLETAGWAGANTETREAFQTFLRQVKAAGIDLVTRREDPLVEEVERAIADAMPISRQVNTWEDRWPLNTYARDMDANKLSAGMRQRLADADAMTQEEYQQALGRRTQVRATYAKLSASFAACITLPANGPAPKGLGSTGDATFAVVSSVLGTPSLSLPYLTVEGLPLGIQLVGFQDQDTGLFETASWLDSTVRG